MAGVLAVAVEVQIDLMHPQTAFFEDEVGQFYRTFRLSPKFGPHVEDFGDTFFAVDDMRSVVAEPKDHRGDVDRMPFVVLGVTAHVDFHVGRSGHGGDVIAHIVLQFPTHHTEPSVGLLHAFKLG